MWKDKKEDHLYNIISVSHKSITLNDSVWLGLCIVSRFFDFKPSRIILGADLAVRLFATYKIDKIADKTQWKLVKVVCMNKKLFFLQTI